MQFPVEYDLAFDPGQDPNAGPVEFFEWRLNGGPAQQVPPGQHFVRLSIPGPGTYTGEVRATNAVGSSAWVPAVLLLVLPDAPINVRWQPVS